MPDGRSLISIMSGDLSAQIDPLGAQLFSLRDKAGEDLLWNGDPAFWTGRAPILFPIIGMLSEGRYRLDDVTYAMPKHGFARHSLFEQTEASPQAATLVLRATADTLKIYPFHFELSITFAVTASTLSLKAEIRNAGDGAMPASFGFHPALRWPLPFGRPRSEHRLHFEKPEPAPIRRINSEGVVKPQSYPTPIDGQDLHLQDALFEDDAIIFDQLRSRRLRYSAGEGPGLDVAFPKTPYLGAWMKPGADFICIEPWHGVADPEGFKGDFRQKPGVFEVAPGSAHYAEMSITLTSSS